jgi:hypothetical protein
MKKSVEKGEPFYYRTICSLIKQGKFKQKALQDELNKFNLMTVQEETDFSLSCPGPFNI